MPKFGAVHGKLVGGGVAFALATDWCACPSTSSFNYGNLPRGVNPLFMFSRALPLIVGHQRSFLLYVEDMVLSGDLARTLGLVHKVTANKGEAQHAAFGEAKHNSRYMV